MKITDLKAGDRFLIDKKPESVCYRDPEWFDAEVLEFSVSKKHVKIKWNNRQNSPYYEWFSVNKVLVGDLLNKLKVAKIQKSKKIKSE